MPTEDVQSASQYFETPERAERLQLVTHLLSNADEVPYLRGPSGSGKTRFAAHLVEKTDQDFVVVWLDAARAGSVRDEMAAQLGLDPSQLTWPGDPLGVSDDKPLLVIIDDADQFELTAFNDLYELHVGGARLLFLGNGDLSQLQGDWDLQFVDLPPFTEQQSLDFLNRQGRALGVVVDEGVAPGLHRAAGGSPGHLLDALSVMPAGKSAKGQPSKRKSSGLSPQMLLLGSFVILVAVLALVFQDAINDLFEPAAIPAETPVGESVAPVVQSLPSVAPTGPTEPREPEVLSIERSESVHEQPAAMAEPPLEPKADAETDVSTVASRPPAEPLEELVAAETEEPADPVLDAVIEAAIAAAQQAPQNPAPVESPKVSPPELEKEAPVAVPKETVVPQDPVTETAPTEPPQIAPEPSSQDGVFGEDWLRAQRPQDYTLQLVGARDRAAIRAFITRHNVQPPSAVFQRELNGKPWFSLVSGVFPDRDAAIAARARLKPPLNGSGVWPRSYASIQEQLTNPP